MLFVLESVIVVETDKSQTYFFQLFRCFCNLFSCIMATRHFLWYLHCNRLFSIVPASAIVLTLGTISAYTFHLLGRLTSVAIQENDKKESKQTSSTVNSIGELWEYEVGKSSSWLVSASIFLTCFMTCLAYSIILGDTLSSLAETAGFTVSN